MKNALAVVLIALGLAFFAGCSSVKYESETSPPNQPAYSLGYLKVNLEKPVPDIAKATEAAYKDLGISVTNAKSDDLTGKVEGKLADGKDVTTDITSVSSKESSVSIRIGTLGDKDFSYRILDKIKKNL
ncbi:MAG: DUF3568 family protein [Nitrospiraceae bacterium]|nr:DUF3568 family protein [Nitrospiraceae bacterium]